MQIIHAAKKQQQQQEKKKERKRKRKLTTSLSVWGLTSRNQVKRSLIFVYDSVEWMTPH